MDFEVNGRTYKLEGDPERNLLGVLRDELDLTGTKGLLNNNMYTT